MDEFIWEYNIDYCMAKHEVLLLVLLNSIKWMIASIKIKAIIHFIEFNSN